MQFGRHRGNGAACDGIPVCCDLNEVAYGNKVVVIVDNWAREKYRVINLDSAVLEKMKNSLLLFYYYHRYGLFIIHWRAAIMGCDISEKGVASHTPERKPSSMRCEHLATNLPSASTPTALQRSC